MGDTTEGTAGGPDAATEEGRLEEEKVDMNLTNSFFVLLVGDSCEAVNPKEYFFS